MRVDMQQELIDRWEEAIRIAIWRLRTRQDSATLRVLRCDLGDLRDIAIDIVIWAWLYKPVSGCEIRLSTRIAKATDWWVGKYMATRKRRREPLRVPLRSVSEPRAEWSEFAIADDADETVVLVERIRAVATKPQWAAMQLLLRGHNLHTAAKQLGVSHQCVAQHVDSVRANCQDEASYRQAVCRRKAEKQRRQRTQRELASLRQQHRALAKRLQNLPSVGYDPVTKVPIAVLRDELAKYADRIERCRKRLAYTAGG